MALAFTTHVTAGEAMKFVVNEWIQLVERGLIPVAPFSEQLSDVMLRGSRQFLMSCLKLGDLTRFSKHLVYFTNVELFLCDHAPGVVFKQHRAVAYEFV